MNSDRRSLEASSFRTFFDNQLHHLQELANMLGSHIRNEEQQNVEDRQIVESLVDASNRKIRAVHGYSGKLRKHVRALYTHVLQVADQIPPPVGLSQETFRTVPLVNALFVGSKDIDKLFQTDPDVQAYARIHDQHQVPVLYALLTASKSKKTTLGLAIQGDQLIRDVPQQAVNFSLHKIHAPCASRAELSAELKKYLFDRVVMVAKQEMMSRMTNQSPKTGDDCYTARVNSLANPDVYLNTLIEYIEIPSQLLSIEKSHVRLSKLGIKLGSEDNQSANEFDIHELTWGGGTRNVALQIIYTR
ncbi:MAG: hypothetical protein Q7U57_11850 [Methylovulum sp.]|nr:hypothetical protein [Methylovulum sp.]